jgi:hypothetical protein
MRGRTRNWFAAVAWVILLGTSSRVSKAEAIPPTYPYRYETSGTIGSEGVSGSPVISFRAVDDAQLAGIFSLGEFVTGYPNSGTTTYANTSFQIDFTLQDFGKIRFTGVLNGSVDIDGKSSVVATFDLSHAIMVSGPGAQEAEAFLIQIARLNEGRTLTLTAPCKDCGVTRILAQATPTPEPASIAFFAAAFGGLALLGHRGRGSSRRPGAPPPGNPALPS